MRLPVLLFLALPFAEIAGFVIVGRQIGVLATLALVIAAAIAGAMLLRIQGFGVMTRIRAEMDAGRDPSRELANGAMILVAAVLLLIPGFITDIVGLLLFLPPVRAVAWRLLKSRVVVSTAGFSRAGPGGARGRTIDLDADEYKRGPQPDSPWRRLDGD